MTQVGETIRSCHVVVAGRRSRLQPGGKVAAVDPHLAIIAFPVIFLGELPDKTMFASLIMATHGRPRQVWLGAAAAFAIHVVIATTLGVALFAVLPERGVEALVAGVFAVGSVLAWRESVKDRSGLARKEISKHGVVLTAFIVIFLAEWGDITQLLTANLAARYHSALSVGIGAVLALWAVAALAVASGQTLLRFVNTATIRRLTSVVLALLALYTAVLAVAGNA
jgi:putative Ca2+/H+ antiporter (TMEM165/GDT1 family)